MSTCYANPSPEFQPAMRLISAITQSNPAVVTTSFAHQYHTGLIVRLKVPVADGMQQIDNQQGTITVLDEVTFAIDIDAALFEPFAIPDDPNPHVDTCAQVIPIGEVNETIYYATQNVLPLTQ